MGAAFKSADVYGFKSLTELMLLSVFLIASESGHKPTLTPYHLPSLSALNILAERASPPPCYCKIEHHPKER